MYTLTQEEIDKLQSFAATTISKNVEVKLEKFGIKADLQEIMSEIWNQYSYLLKNFVVGEKSFTSYCYKYTEQLVVQAFRRDRDTHKNFVEFDEQPKSRISYYDDDNEEDDDDDSTMAVYDNPATSLIKKEQKMNAMTLDDNTIILNENLQKVLSKMSIQDLEIAKMYFHGISFEKIGDCFGMSAAAVAKRLRKYAEEQ